MTVGELIAELSRFSINAPVVATWEGIFRKMQVYASRDGVVVIDAYGGFYRSEVEVGEILVELARIELLVN